MIIIVYINKDRNMHRDMLEFLIKQLTVFASLIYPSNCKKKHGTPLTRLSPFCQRYDEDLSRVRCVNCNGIKTVYNVAHTNRVCACHEFAQHVNNLLWLYSARTPLVVLFWMPMKERGVTLLQFSTYVAHRGQDNLCTRLVDHQKVRQLPLRAKQTILRAFYRYRYNQMKFGLDSSELFLAPNRLQSVFLLKKKKGIKLGYKKPQLYATYRALQPLCMCEYQVKKKTQGLILIY